MADIVRPEVLDVQNSKMKESCEAVQFICDRCDFKSNWENALNVHKSKMHSIEQTNGENVDEDEFTRKYWSTGKILNCFQTFLDINNDNEDSNLQMSDKAAEKEKVLEARKEAFGNDFKHYPPWEKW